VGQPQVVLTLDDVIGKLVAQRKAHAIGRPIRSDHIDPGDFRFFAAVLGEPRRRQGALRRCDDGAIALVEPFGLSADHAGLGLAALKTHLEHLHGVGQGRGVGKVLVHLVPPLGRAEVGQAGAGDDHVSGIGMVDGRQDPALDPGRVQIDVLTPRALRNRGVQGLPTAYRLHGQFQSGLDARQGAADAAFSHGHHSMPVAGAQLHKMKTHDSSLTIAVAPSRGGGRPSMS
jgi:hypothetical protein